jgi:ectoine hydroxylase-related dioxygenase (phytanoyl-CoA dioxygenase family)
VTVDVERHGGRVCADVGAARRAPPGHQGGAHIQPPAASTTTYLEVATSDQVLDALEPVLGPNIELVENRHNHVSIYRAASTDRLHRDILQWSRSILTVLVYLSDCTDLDAATRVVPGSHLWPCIGKPNNGGTWMAEVEPYASLLDQAVAVPAAAGDAVLMHGQLYHAGPVLSTARPRVVLTLAYRSLDELAGEAPARCRLVRGSRIHCGRGAARV